MASLTATFALFVSALGCQISPEMEEKVEFATQVGLDVDPAEIAKRQKIEAIISEVETLLDNFKNGSIERSAAIVEFQNLCDQLGELAQEDEATPIRIQDTGMRILLEMDALREGILDLLYDGEPRTREEIGAVARTLRSGQD